MLPLIADYAVYLGAGCYADLGSYVGEVKLYTSNGERITNEIILDQSMLDRLMSWNADTVRQLMNDQQQSKETNTHE